ncbi:MAG TPA: hypothetical protein VNL69_10700 [Bacteroidota bacterium]|nr:hypothetical protein [Bacteroidota bacterium]
MATAWGWFLPHPLVLACLTICCKADDVGVQDETYIPLITNQWTDVARPDHRFNFLADQAGVSRGTFTGTEEAPEFPVDPTLRGSFSNRSISFTVARPGGDTTFQGRFTADTLIDLGGLRIFRRN